VSSSIGDQKAETALSAMSQGIGQGWERQRGRMAQRGVSVADSGLTGGAGDEISILGGVHAALFVSNRAAR
jgi:hypothetical protein